MNKHIKVIPQGGTEPAEEYGERMQEYLDSINIEAESHSIMAFPTSSQNGRLTTVITWSDKYNRETELDDAIFSYQHNHSPVEVLERLRKAVDEIERRIDSK